MSLSVHHYVIQPVSPYASLPLPVQKQVRENICINIVILSNHCSDDEGEPEDEEDEDDDDEENDDENVSDDCNDDSEEDGEIVKENGVSRKEDSPVRWHTTHFYS